MPRRRAQVAREGNAAHKKGKQNQMKGHERYSVDRNIPVDPEDSFHQDRGRIQLNDHSHESEDDEEVDEIFPLKTGDTSGSQPRGLPDSPETDYSTVTPQPSLSKKQTHKPAKSQGPTNADSDSTDQDDEGWGKKKAAYYSTNAGELEDEDDESQELYLQESLRLQNKARSLLSEKDFGFEDYRSTTLDDLALAPSLIDERDKALVFSTREMSYRDLEKEHPELLALSRDWIVASEELTQLERRLTRLGADDSLNTEQGLTHLYHRTLQCYLTLLAFYLHMSSSGVPLRHLKSHPIISRLLVLRESTQELGLLGLGDHSDSDGDSENLSVGSDSEEAHALSTVSSCSSESSFESSSTKDAMDGQTIERQLDWHVLDEPSFSSQTIQPHRRHNEANHFGDPLSMERFDAEDKRARKKTLRFHAAKIDGMRPHQGVARHSRGGDDDLVYPRRDGNRTASQHVVANTTSPVRKKRLRELGDEALGDESDDYYDLVKRQKKRIKDEKKEVYEAERAGRSGDVLDGESESGPRSLTRAILTNKGLTPQRSKAVRNPRVKKRMKYEKAKHKLSSQRQVYRGGPAGGKYAGEMTGINTQTVKSARF